MFKKNNDNSDKDLGSKIRKYLKAESDQFPKSVYLHPSWIPWTEIVINSMIQNQ